jgi:hypothetical protein
MPYNYGPTYVGDYDDTCEMCGREQSAAVYSDKTTWFCSPCEYENKVREEE